MNGVEMGTARLGVVGLLGAVGCLFVLVSLITGLVVSLERPATRYPDRGPRGRVVDCRGWPALRGLDARPSQLVRAVSETWWRVRRRHFLLRLTALVTRSQR